MTRRDPAVAVVGAGMSGLCVAIALLRSGITDVTIYEKADEVGGTWRDNTYPGLVCDIPSRIYQYSFAKNPDWSHLFSPGGEIQAYFRDVADRYALRDRIRFGTEISHARFDDGRWVLRTDAGEESTVDFLISATGVLHHPRLPSIPGLDDFGGNVFHSARWDHGVDVRGRRVAIVGNGSTGVQLVCGLAGVAGHVALFQRTAQWVLRLANPRYSGFTGITRRKMPWLDGLAYRIYSLGYDYFAVGLTKPGLRRKIMAALCRASLWEIRDPELRRALTPDYTPACKRLVMSNGFYRADAARRRRAGDDEHRPCGTARHRHRRRRPARDGHHRARHRIRHACVLPADGVDRPRRHLCQRRLARRAAGLPNRRAVRLSQLLHDAGAAQPGGKPRADDGGRIAGRPHPGLDRALAPGRIRHGRADAPRRPSVSTPKLRAAMPDTVWTTGCNSWYLNKDGVPEVWPLTPAEHRRMLANPDPGQYDLRRHVAAG